jgi:SAM-dependent methyltransferase
MQLLSLLRYVRARRRSRDVAAGAGDCLGYCKACNREDFARPELRELVRTIFLHDLVRLGESFPDGREDRLYWRTAMTARTFADHGLLRPGARVLGVAAGSEPALFWLTNKAGWVFAVDRYLETGSRANAHSAAMVLDPDRHWPGSWNRRRLVVQHMTPQDLRFSDDTFDAVFTAGALDDCHDAEALGRALEEMHRVLKPGGVLSLTVELHLEGPRAGTERRVFDESEVRETLAGGQDWKPLGAIDLGVSEATRLAEQPVAAVEAEVNRHLGRHGQLLWHERAGDHTPALAVRDGEVLSVPAHLALRKADRHG